MQQRTLTGCTMPSMMARATMLGTFAPDDLSPSGILQRELRTRRTRARRVALGGGGGIMLELSVDERGCCRRRQ